MRSRVGLTNIFFLCLILLTVAMPPGVCPCWVNPEVKTVHPHFSPAHAENQHAHDYLSQMSQTTSTQILPLVIISANLLIALAFAGLIWWGLRAADISETGWSPGMPVEPPRTGA